MEEYFERDGIFWACSRRTCTDLRIRQASDQVFFLPMHAFRKDSSTTTKLQIVFDASAKILNGMPLNDKLLVGPTVHTSLIDVLLRFWLHRVALIADVRKMYRAIKLVESDKDLHRFLWRRNPNDDIIDYRMSRVTFQHPPSLLTWPPSRTPLTTRVNISLQLRPSMIHSTWMTRLPELTLWKKLSSYKTNYRTC